MRIYTEMSNIGHAKYVVNYHDGAKLHADGSKFFDIRLFSNKRVKDAFIKSLRLLGYVAGV